MISAISNAQTLILPELQVQGILPEHSCKCRHCGAPLTLRTTKVPTWYFHHPKSDCKFHSQVKAPDSITSHLKWETLKLLKNQFRKLNPQVDADVLWEAPFEATSDLAMRLSTGEVYAGWVLTHEPKKMEELQERIKLFQDHGIDTLLVLYHAKLDPNDAYRKFIPMLLRNNCMVLTVDMKEQVTSNRLESNP